MKLISFRLWMMCKRVEKYWHSFKNLNVFQYLSKSTILRVLKMLLLSFIVLWIVFLFSPKQGYMHYSCNEMNAAKIESSNVYANVYSNAGIIKFDGQAKYSFENANFLVDGQYYFDEVTDFEFVVEVGGKTPNTHFWIEALNEYSNICFSSYELVETTINYSGISVKGLEEGEHRLSIEAPNDKKDVMVKFFFDRWQNVESFGVAYNGNVVAMDVPTNENPLILTSSYFLSSVIKGTEVNFYSTSTQMQISLKDISQGEIVSTGDLNFNYSIHSQQFDLEDQKLSFSDTKSKTRKQYPSDLSENLQLYADIISDDIAQIEKSDFTIYGKVTAASIEGFDLFPTFFAWLNENIYLVASSIFAGILGGIKFKEKT